MKQIVFLIVILITFNSCGEFQKALKSDDTKVKFDLGTKLYDEGKYNKAQRLFVQIVPNYRGKPQAEKLMYMYADTFFQTEDYYLAAFQFDRFVKSYPKSQRLDEASFKSAKSSYLQSPRYSLDQEDTYEAIEKMQSFINTFPESDKLAEANKVVEELEEKIEKKDFEIAKQFHHISDYKAAIKSLDNFINDYPGSERKSEAFYLRFDAAYLLAIKSVKSKKLERLKKAEEYYNKLKSSHGDSEYMKEATKGYEKISEELKENENDNETQSNS